MKWHPLQSIPEGWPQWTVCIALLCLFLWLGGKAGGPRESGRPGVIHLELAWNQPEAQKILKIWDAQGVRDKFRDAIYWDFGFILVYPLALGLACIMVARSFPISALRGEGFVAILNYALLVAGVLDCIENVCMLQVLKGSAAAHWPFIASLCASIKFILIAGGLMYWLTGALGWAFSLFKPAGIQTGSH